LFFYIKLVKSYPLVYVFVLYGNGFNPNAADNGYGEKGIPMSGTWLDDTGITSNGLTTRLPHSHI
jgi:hypothetical protein